MKTTFDHNQVTVDQLMGYFFEIIDPYSINKQGDDVGEKYRTGVYSEVESHLTEARRYINHRDDSEDIQVEVLPLNNYVKSAAIHQDHLDKYPDDYCHIPQALLLKYIR